MLSILVITLYCLCGVSWACAPTDDDADPCRQPEMELTSDQISRVNQQRLFELENDFDKFLAARHNEVIVELTPEQIDAAVRMNPQFFQSKKDLPPLPANGERQDRFKRQFNPFPTQGTGGGGGFSTRKCPPVQSFSTFTLAVNGFGNVVQIIQPMGGNAQWIMDESCSTFVYGPGDNCNLAERLVAAYVIDFKTYDFSVEWITVYCCATFT